MDAQEFDRLTRGLSKAGTRRRLLGALASVGLGGLLAHLVDDAAEARRKRRGRKRSHRPGNDKDNRKGKRKGKDDRRGRLGGTQCGTTGSDCTRDRDCCSNNCFNFSCDDKVHRCGADDSARQCRPPAKGCAGETCCYGAVSCDEGCCQPPANQCNQQGVCCAPNCAGRSCGPDGCGVGGTCGTCPSNATCNEITGQCQSACTPRCKGKQCGDDGCGGSCGACGTGEICRDDGTCAMVCESDPQCGAGAICLDDGTCQACTISCPGSTCGSKKLQRAINAGGMVYVCPGRYTGSLTVGRATVTVIGAGQGDDERFDTILDAQGSGVGVRSLESGSFALHRLRITGARSSGLVNMAGDATIVDCTITGNAANLGGGVMSFNADTTLTRCTVSFNAADDGGGIRQSGNGKLTVRDSRIANNTAETFGGGVTVSGRAELINCEVTENTGGEDSSRRAGGIAVIRGEAELHNSFVWNNIPLDCSGTVTGSKCGEAPPA